MHFIATCQREIRLRFSLLALKLTKNVADFGNKRSDKFGSLPVLCLQVMMTTLMVMVADGG